MSTEQPPINSQPTPSPENRETTVQQVDVSLLWTFAVLALLMSILFIAAVPLCVIALVREPDVFVVVCLLCAVGMACGLVGTGVGLIRRARKARHAQTFSE